MSAATPQKQSVFMARYGLRECALVEEVGPFDMDISFDGVEHAQAAAVQLSFAADGQTPTRVYCSPFLRAAHTAHEIATRLGVRVCVEEGLTEWLTTALVGGKEGSGVPRHMPRTPAQLANTFNTIDADYASVGSATYTESEPALLTRMSDTLTRLLAQSPTASFLIVSHAPCLLAAALALEGKGAAASQLEPWPLGGITQFTRPLPDDAAADNSVLRPDEWTMTMNGDCQHMPGGFKQGLQRWTLPCLDKSKPTSATETSETTPAQAADAGEEVDVVTSTTTSIDVVSVTAETTDVD